MKFTPERLQQELSTIIDPFFAEQLASSYIEMMQRFYSGDWKPSELDGGQFCEAISRAFYQIDTGTILNDLPGKVIDQIKNKSISHKFSGTDRNHFCSVVDIVYRFRNQRGIAHISPTHNANHMDAMFVIANVKWMFAEFLRLAWNKDRNEVAEIIESIIRLEHPLICEIDGHLLVLSTSLSAADEILMLLQHSMPGSVSRAELKESILKDQSTISRAIIRLISEKKILANSAGDLVVTPLGQRYVHEEIIPRLASNNRKK